MHPDRDKEAERRIVGRFPELFILPAATPAVGNGWLPIVERMCERIHPIVISEPDQCLCGYAHEKHPVIVEQREMNVWVKPWAPTELGIPATRTLCEKWRPCKPHFQQIKQKLGELRVHINFSHQDIVDAIRIAEKEASVTCEDCGKEGKEVLIAGWIAVLCSLCERHQRVDREGWRIEEIGEPVV